MSKNVFSANSIIQSSLVNDNFTELYDNLNPIQYKFHVYRNAAQNNNTSFVVVQCDTKVFDTGSNVDITTNKGRFTAPISGVYWFSGGVQASLSGAGYIGCSLFKNGVRVLDGNYLDLSFLNTINNGTYLSGMLSLVAGDYVELQCIGNSAYALAVGTQYFCYFQGLFIST